MVAERSVKRFSILILLLLSVAAGGVFAQNGKRKSPGSNICVAKSLADYEDANFNTIQAAVNAAKPGQVIEILDVGAYNEQVTIDGRDDAPWGNTVVGGKNGITIRYVPVAGSTARPTITYNDRTNVSPKTCAEAKTLGDTVGSRGNFETNGAVRIIRASGVIIEGLIIDGGGKYTFGYNSVWDETATCANSGGCDGKACPLFHGNAAVAIAVSGNVEIRDCELRNAHFGIAVKDRNTGGVFGNPNPVDNDFTIPLSGFGKTGNHLFEYNKIGNNDIGLFFESSWDLGSTVRYNLIYSNYMASIPTGPGSDADKASGAIGFKDSFLSPIAIYNNTFYDNNMNFIGFWQVGFQHLIFNNIFSKPHAYGQPATVSYMCIDHMFPQRMKHCLLSADGAAPSGPPYYIVPFNKFTQPQQGGGNNGIQPGVVITGSQDGGNFPNGANNKWLETAGLFKSTSPASADFLAPDWTNSSVTSFIRNQGWPDAGILNEDGTVADLGAVPYSGKKPFSNPLEQKSRIRVSPLSVVKVAGQTASTVFYVNEEIGKLTGLTVKYIRWVSPIPDNTNSLGSDIKKSNVVPPGSIGTPTATGTIVPGNNRIEFRLPAAVSSNNQYGFFEVVLQGKDANGNTVTTDVGFLPYKALEYTLKIEVLKSTTVVTQVQAGDLVTLRVTPYKGTTVYTTTKLNEAEFTLLPDLATHIWESDTKEFITAKDLGPGAATYPNVFFKSAGDIVISAAGLYQDNPTRPTISLSFLGETSLLVTPGPAAKLRVFYGDAGGVNNTTIDPDAVIFGNANEWFKVTVKVVGNDAVVTSRNQYVAVDATEGLILSATEGGAAATTFQLNSGIATFYVSANSDVVGACVNVTAMSSDIVDGSVSSGNRCGITFKKPTTGGGEIEDAPTVISAHYTSNPATGKVNYAYVKFDKAVNINGWFAGAGGYVKIGTNRSDSTGVTSANAGTLLSVAQNDQTMLVVNLSEAYKSSQSAIRTSGDMPVAFGFVPQDGEKWADVNVTAKDRAAPVLADTVYLRLGSLTEDGSMKTPDTLIAVYSEQLDAASLTLKQPVTILTDGGQSECRPTLTELSHANDKGTFYKVTYLFENMICDIPKSGEYVRINSAAGVGDFVIPPNPQTAPDNLKWPIKVIPGITKWKVAVKNNPFRTGAGRDGVLISLRPGVSVEATDVEANAKIYVFDNLGNVVVDTLVVTETDETGEYKVINWRWNGADRKGRLVKTGTYLFKAACEVRTTVGGGGDATVDKQRYSTTQYIGVVRGEGGFGLGKNPVSSVKSSGGGVSFYWDGGGVSGGALFVYDASGNVVKKIGVAGESAGGGSGRRKVGEWDLTDADGRIVAEGSYVVAGTIKVKGGRSERVSAIVGVGR